MASRWSNLPYSEQEQLYLAQTTTTLDGDQILCYYKNVVNDSPIPYVCELGCCPHGCCGIQEISQSNTYGWAIALFFVLVFIIIFALMALFTVCYIHRQKSQQRRQNGLNSIDESISGSQVSSSS
ncbi:unnamed protein product [Enterobius vermicularis]|uniref:CX domain-containing protein n=1 Tax=Enterobius vermicularis TaxID=51028 RepID=A0A0N4UTJ0_ENTVE|nr:unnamed protein product [Enterobius vermicularis]